MLGRKSPMKTGREIRCCGRKQRIQVEERKE
jgi:hypothetical protein